jgi:hypothetical protein
LIPWESAGQIALDEIRCSKADVLWRPVVFCPKLGSYSLLSLHPYEACACVRTVGSGDQPGFPQVVLGLEIFDFGLVRSVNASDRSGQISQPPLLILSESLLEIKAQILTC